MSNQLDRTRFGTKGLGTLEVSEVTPTPADFVPLGVLAEEGSEVDHTAEELLQHDEDGKLWDVQDGKESDVFNTKLAQVGIDEVDIIKDSGGKTHALRYHGTINEYGRFQYFCMELGRIVPHIAASWKPQKQNLPFSFLAMKQDASTFDTPIQYKCEADKRLYLDGLQLWLEARLGLNVETTRILDISGHARHAILYPLVNCADIWQQGTPANFLRFNGSDQYASLGDVLDDDGTSDFTIEVWAKTPAADGGVVEILGKKNLVSDHSAGFAMRRETNNTISFKISDGDESTTVVSAATLLQNVWKHIAITIDRSAWGQMYINGVASGAAESVAALEAAALNALPFYIGAINGTEFGQVDIGNVRLRKWAAGGLPSDIVTQLLSHYNAEKSYHGL
ncbi:MAG: LamG domain-containing protein [Thermoplasmata archaeon]|nr:LamG domain-containing protein [Thermoplasmata archaeon]